MSINSWISSVFHKNHYQEPIKQVEVVEEELKIVPTIQPKQEKDNSLYIMFNSALSQAQWKYASDLDLDKEQAEKLVNYLEKFRVNY